MTVRELYKEAIIAKQNSVILLLDFLVKEKKVIKMEDPAEKINYYLQEKYTVKMNQYLAEYREKSQQRL